MEGCSDFRMLGAQSFLAVLEGALEKRFSFGVASLIGIQTSGGTRNRRSGSVSRILVAT
jgi:hypothetical protein